MYIQYFLNSLLAFVTSMLPRLYLSLVGTLVGCAVFINGVSANAADFKTNYAAKAYLSLNKPATAPMADPNAKAKATQNLQSASLLFIENNGQVADQEGKLHPEILFTAKAAGAQVYVTGSSIHYLFTKVERETKSKEQRDPHQRDSIKGVSTHRFTLELVGANTKPELVKQEANPYYENYYLAHCPNGVVARSYEKFTLKQVYPGVDWVVYSNGQGLKYDFVLAKGSDASKIKLRVKDADASLNAEGDLVMKTTLGEVVEDKPVSFQEGQELATRFMQLGNQTFGFALPNANNTAPLTIDPSVAWATYYGGSRDDYGNSCATDAAGNVYLAGKTNSTNFPVAGAFQGTFGGSSSLLGGDAFLVKFSSTGSRLWASYYGGSGDDVGYSCATDAAGNIYLAGFTGSTNFPVAGAFQGTNAGNGDAFLVKLDSTGSRLWATYYGGSSDESGNSCATDAFGNVYLAGHTYSTNFPVAGAFQGTNAGDADAFLVKFNSAGSRLWATYYGGSMNDKGITCATDPLSNVYIVGVTASTNFPVARAFQGRNAGRDDAFVVKFNDTGSRLWATYYGGDDFDEGQSCATDVAGNVYLAGYTRSTNFPVAGSFQGTNVGNYDAFLVKFNDTGSRLWATYYGGSATDWGYSCSTDAAGNVYLAGNTYSTNFPVARAFQGNHGGSSDAFLVKFNSTGSRQWATFFGKSNADFGYSCATDAIGNVYLAGVSNSNNLPVTGAFQVTNSGGQDAFLVKFRECPATPVITRSGPTTLCTGGSITLTAPAGFSYLWSNNATTQTITVNTAGSYTVRTIANGCTSATSAATVVTVNPRPTASIAVTNDSMVANPAGATYRWLFNGTLVQGQTSRGLRARQSGPYQVIVTVNGCSDTSAAVLITNLATKSNNPTLTLHPNPATSSVLLNLSYGDINQVEVIDQLGRAVLNTKEVKNNSLDISSLAAGSYMVRVVSSGGVTVRKLVKN